MKKEIVYTEEYALILSDGVIKEGDYFLTDDGRIEIDALDWKAREWHKKIIGHLPISDAPILEGVPLLPSFSWSQQDDVVKIAEECGNAGIITSIRSFVVGYDKAKEKYKYTEEDMLKAMKFAKTFSSSITDIHYIQSLQQPSRPTHFECEMEEYVKYMPNIHSKYYLPKTTTNSQGQVELVGKYI